MSFSDFPQARADIVPSIHRQLSGIGRLAKANGCAIEVTCVGPAGADDAAKRIRNQQCGAAIQAIIAYETRRTVRSALVKQIKQVRANAGGGFSLGTVYVTLK